MRGKRACPKCGSKDVHIGAQMNDYVEYVAPKPASIRAYENPSAMIFKGARDVQVVADVCTDCGFIELYAENPEKLKMLQGQKRLRR